MNQQESQPVESSQPKQGPGDKLQTARISRGMTLEEVASKMHLSTGILTSLEENNFDDITAPIFVKGYLRAYSRLVNIDENEIIQQYATCYMNGDPPINSTSNTSPEINANDSKIKWITYLIVIGLIALLSTWWWNRYQQAPEMVSLESGNESKSESLVFEESANAVDQVTNDIETDQVNSTQSSLQLDITEVAESIELQQNQLDELATDSAEMQISAESDTNLNETVSAGLETTTLEDSISMEPEAVVAEVLEPVVQNDKDLVITVNADTWASIKDADGNKLVYDLLKSGQQITVTGKTPFRAFLGNGYGVSMKYKGKDIDLSRVIKSDNTARINIGQ